MGVWMGSGSVDPPWAADSASSVSTWWTASGLDTHQVCPTWS
jgi:hypothetical protein